MDNTDANDKMDTMLEVLQKGIAMLHLDPRKPEVRVPDRFREDPILRLNFAYGFNLPGFTVDLEGVTAILNFNKERFSCSIPWDAVFAITSPEGFHQGRIWSASLPPELLAEWLAERRRQKLTAEKDPSAEKPRDTDKQLPPPRKLPTAKNKKPVLRVVSTAPVDDSAPDGSAPDDGTPPDEPPPSPTKPPTKPKLRLV